jgi:hypothetical protein
MAAPVQPEAGDAMWKKEHPAAEIRNGVFLEKP